MKSKHIIFVHGLFGWGADEMAGFPYFGDGITTMQEQLKKNGLSDVNVHEASCGPVSSFHDRACEVFAQIIGGKVNYDGVQKQHSEQNHHGTSTKDYSKKAFVSDWSENNPIVLIGHSAGAHTCLQLQQLLVEDFWGCGSNANWVEAVVCISGVLNGSTLPYMLGCDKVTGELTGAIGNFLSMGVQILSGLNRGLTRNLFDWDLEQWVGQPETTELSEFIEKLKNSQFAKSNDNLAYDLTLQGCKKANERFKTNANTYYLSVITEQTFGIQFFKKQQLPSVFMNPALATSAFYQGVVVNFDNDKQPIEGWGTGDLSINKWRENDGAVSSISQRFPFTGGNHPVGGEGFMNRPTLTKGRWYYEKAESITGKSMDHFDVVFGHITDISLGDAHRSLYIKLCNRLCSL
jgi:triacylglycerol lipase